MYIVGVAYGVLTDKKYFWLRGQGDIMKWEPGKRGARRFQFLDAAMRAAYLNTVTLPETKPTKIVIMEE